MKDFRTVIRERRIALQFTQAGFAKSLKTTAKHINLIENCHAYPSFPLLYKILKKLDLQMEINVNPVGKPIRTKWVTGVGLVEIKK